MQRKLTMQLNEDMANAESIAIDTNENLKINIKNDKKDSCNIDKLHNLLNIVGTENTYQKNFLINSSIFSFFLPFLTCILPFIFYQPDFFCNERNGNIYKCNENQACENAFGYSTVFNIHSFVEKYNLYCERSYLAILGKTAIFILASFFATISVLVSDYIGRLKAYYLQFMLLLSGNILCVFSVDYELRILGLSFLFSVSFAYYSLTFIYGYEITGNLNGGRLQKIFNNIIFLTFALGEIAFYPVSLLMNNYQIFLVVESVVLLIAAISFLTIYESPAYLYNKERYTELKKVLIGISNINFKDDQHLLVLKKTQIDEIIEDLSDKQSKKEKNKFDKTVRSDTAFDPFISKQKIIMQIIFYIIIISNLCVLEGILTLIPQEMGIDNIYLNGVLLSIIDFVSYISLVFLVHKIKRRKYNKIINSLIILVGITGLITYMFGVRELLIGKTIETINSLIGKLLMCMSFVYVFSYGTEIFDIRFRGIALGLSIFIGRIAMSSGAILIDVTQRFNIHPIVGTLSTSIFAFLSSFYLPETLKK